MGAEEGHEIFFMSTFGRRSGFLFAFSFVDFEGQPLLL